MPQDASEVRVGADGQLYVAPEATTQPTNQDTVLNAAFGTALGYTDDNGVSVSDGKTVTDIAAWQSFYPVRSIITAREFTIGFTLLQWRGTNLKFAFSGATVTGTYPNLRLSPPASSVLDVKVLVLDWQDSGFKYRLVVQRCMVTEPTTFNVQRTGAAGLAVGVKVLAPTSGDPWYLLSNDNTLLS